MSAALPRNIGASSQPKCDDAGTLRAVHAHTLRNRERDGALGEDLTASVLQRHEGVTR
jgi:hypothetical protein